jgi:hypothetical protein
MKQYTITIPDDKDAFFLEFMKMVAVQVIEENRTDIPQWHIKAKDTTELAPWQKKIIDERLNHYYNNDIEKTI